MNYHQQYTKIIDFIGQHLDDELTLESLSDTFYISKFHFHRLFTAFTGLSLHQYIRWLRLKRAARQLIVNKDQSIINIAIMAGFESHESFSRVFKKMCGLSPSQYRQKGIWFGWEQSPYCLPKKDKTEMKVEIKNLDRIRLAVIEHRGNPKLISDSIVKLVAWAMAQSVNLKPKPGDALSLAYDDPKITPAAEYRMDVGIRIPENLKLNGEVVEKHIPAGRYAITMHKGSHKTLSDTVHYLDREWLPNSGNELGDFPCVYSFENFENEVAETELLTECWILLK